MCYLLCNPLFNIEIDQQEQGVNCPQSNQHLFEKQTHPLSLCGFCWFMHIGTQAAAVMHHMDVMLKLIAILI